MSTSRDQAIPAGGTLAESALRGVRQYLSKCTYRPLRDIQCEYDDGIMTLRGRVPSYFLKQMAHELVGGVLGVLRVDNQISVASRIGGSPPTIADNVATCEPDSGEALWAGKQSEAMDGMTQTRGRHGNVGSQPQSWREDYYRAECHGHHY